MLGISLDIFCDLALCVSKSQRIVPLVRRVQCMCDAYSNLNRLKSRAGKRYRVQRLRTEQVATDC